MPHCHQRNLTVIENSMIWCAMFVQSMMLKLQLILMKSRKSDLRNFLVLCNRYIVIKTAKNDCLISEVHFVLLFLSAVTFASGQ